MTREEAISKKAVMQVLAKLGYGDEENAAEPEYMSALADVAREVVEIEALKQESVLDKIKAEIEQEYTCLSAIRVDEILEVGEYLGLKMALKIIDKHIAESEENNAEQS